MKERVIRMRAMASDFDGTLYFMREEEPFRRGDIEAIRRFREGGNLFGICTGRSLQGIRLVVEDRIDFDFYIIASGALILDRNLNSIYKRCISRGLMTEVYRKYEDRAKIIIQANDTVYSFGLDFPLQVSINSMDDIEGDDIYGLSFGTESLEESARITDEINALYGQELIAFQNVYNVDIVARGCSKGNAARFVRDYFSIDCLGGIGDSYNDIPLLENVDYPFTFFYAPDSVQSKARTVVGSVAEAIAVLERDS